MKDIENHVDLVSSLEEHKEVIRELMNVYIINVDEYGSPKSSITEIMKVIDRATLCLKK